MPPPPSLPRFPPDKLITLIGWDFFRYSVLYYLHEILLLGDIRKSKLPILFPTPAPRPPPPAPRAVTCSFVYDL